MRHACILGDIRDVDGFVRYRDFVLKLPGVRMDSLQGIMNVWTNRRIDTSILGESVTSKV